MGIILKRTEKNLPEYRQIKYLYRSAFPAEERAPFRLLMKRRGREGVDFWAVYADEACAPSGGSGTEREGAASEGLVWVGLAYVISTEHLAYLFYLAMDASCRGKGYGSGTLQDLIRQYADKNLLIAIEQLEEDAPNYTERVKRKQFYLKNVLRELPCKIREAKMIYEALGTKEPVSPQEYKQMMQRYLGPVFKHLIPTEILQ